MTITVTIGHVYIGTFPDFDALVKAFGTKAEYCPTSDGWLIFHPINPAHPLRARKECGAAHGPICACT